MPESRVLIDRPLDLRLTLGPLQHGAYDPTIRIGSSEVWRATRTPHGPASLRVRISGREVVAEAWGDGARSALDELPALLGETDPTPDWRPAHPLLAAIQRRMPGLRLPRSGRVFEALLPAIVEQKITSAEAQRSYRRLVGAYGEDAPGPLRLRLAPEPGRLAALPYHAFHAFGLERRRADAIRRAASIADRLERLVTGAAGAAGESEEAMRILQLIPGVGRWTAAETVRVALGDPDAVSVGDFHLPRLVAAALASETRADDARMLELLEPFRGHRARVVRLLEVGAPLPGRRAPRMQVRAIESM